MKKMQKEIQSYEKGKFALQSIVANIDTKVIEQGSIGGKVNFQWESFGFHSFHVLHNSIPFLPIPYLTCEH